MTEDPARVEVRCTHEQKGRMRRNAERDGYHGRAFAVWARAKLLEEPLETPEPVSQTQLFSVQEAAEFCGVSRQHVYTLIEQGKLQAERRPEGLRIHKLYLKKLRKQ